jgi:hypothetical protein
MSGFTKLVPEIVVSSIWNESSDVRVVWITMLAVKDQHGNVRGNRKSLARVANVSTEAVDQALTVLMSPDPDSNSPEYEGRRIVEINGGWFVVNHDAYREKTWREQEAERKRKKREINKNVRTSPDKSGQVPDVSVSASVSASVFDNKGDARGDDEISKPDAKHTWITEPFVDYLQCTKPTSAPWTSICKLDPVDGWMVPIPQNKVDQWEDVFPRVDIPLTIKEVKQKIRDTGKYRKTPAGAFKMLNTWFTNIQNGGR